jgi:hypothetical protein
MTLGLANMNAVVWVTPSGRVEFVQWLMNCAQCLCGIGFISAAETHVVFAKQIWIVWEMKS